MLLAARGLTFLADMLPAACASMVRHGAVASFCQRLLTIEYIDLAEQSLLVRWLGRWWLLLLLPLLRLLARGLQQPRQDCAAGRCCCCCCMYDIHSF
jgi:hypothetical protein